MAEGLHTQAELSRWLKCNISKANYSHGEVVYNHIMETIKSYPKLTPRLGRLKTTQTEAILLDGTVEVSTTRIQDIPIRLVLPEKYPMVPPTLLVKSSLSHKIKPTKNVSEGGGVYLDYFAKWKFPMSDLCTAIKAACDTLGEDVPICINGSAGSTSLTNAIPVNQNSTPLSPLLPEGRDICRHGAQCFREKPEHLQYLKHDHIERLLPSFLENPSSFKISAELKHFFKIENEDKVYVQLEILKDVLLPEYNEQVNQSEVVNIDDRDIQTDHYCKKPSSKTDFTIKSDNLFKDTNVIQDAKLDPFDTSMKNQDVSIISSSNSSTSKSSTLVQLKQMNKPPFPQFDSGKFERIKHTDFVKTIEKNIKELDNGINNEKENKETFVTQSKISTKSIKAPISPVRSPVLSKSHLTSSVQNHHLKGRDMFQNEDCISDDDSNSLKSEDSKHESTKNLSRTVSKEILADSETNNLLIFGHQRETCNICSNFNKKGTQVGKIAKIISRKRFGFVKPQQGSKSKDIFFHAQSIHNLTGKQITLEEGSQVWFEVDKSKHTEKPAAKIIYVDRESSNVKKYESKERIMAGWLSGTVKTKRNNDFCFVQPSERLPISYANKDVFLHCSNISKHLPSIKEGDVVTFLLGARKTEKPEARSAQILHFDRRSNQELVEYMDISIKKCGKILSMSEILPAKSLWRLLSEHAERLNAKEASSFIAYFLVFIRELLKASSTNKQLSNEMATNTMKLPFFSKNGALSKFIVNSCSNFQWNNFKEETMNENHQEIVCSTLYEMVCACPHLISQCLVFLQSITELKTFKETSTWLLKFLKLSAMSTQKDVMAEGSWESVPIIPSSDELLGTPLEMRTHLAPVKKNQPYKSSEDYMDTYFRLLRTECFSSIQKGIKELLNCQLDERDMRVYYNVKVLGYEASTSSFSIAVQFNTLQPVAKWDTSPHLMFGNLLCLSPTGKFNDPIWATVSNRDCDLLNKHQAIVIQFCSEFNTLSISETLMKLNRFAGSTVMVESPQYFHSIRPVLNGIQKFDMESFPLRNEIVECQFNDMIPEYQFDDTRFDASSVTKSKESSNLSFETFHKKIGESMLDESQQTALLHALDSKLSIIQGPPGCGKTFIGIKLAKIILSMKPQPKLPILVLTYKNHALDEFLMDVLKFLNKDEIVRVGGRSKEPELEMCNLKQIARLNPKEKSKTIQGEINNIHEEMDVLREKIDEEMQILHDSSCLTRLDFLEILSEKQLEALFMDAPYGKSGSGNVSIKLNKNTFMDQNHIINMLKECRQKHGTLSEFLKKCEANSLPGGLSSNENKCCKIFEEVVAKWKPKKELLNTLKEVHNQYIKEIKTAQDLNEKEIKEEQVEDDNVFDEQAIEEIQENRLAAMGKTNAKGEFQKTNNLILLKHNSNLNSAIIWLHDFPSNLEKNDNLQNQENLWKLTPVQRIVFLYTGLKQKIEVNSQDLEDHLNQLEKLQSLKKELNTQQEANILASRKVIGMTITGASIHHNLIHQVGPAIVIVEEAGEVLEPDLLAALTPSIQHLTLIGDHKQLRPSVDTYKLKVNYHFDLSLMERLILNGFPYAKLLTQNRMRPEFSALLHDIYPNLKDNFSRVCQNKPLESVAKSMFFWSHTEKEKSARSFTNIEEKERAIFFTEYLLMNGCQPSDITILAAYQGQATIIRKEIKKLQSSKPQLFVSPNSDNFIKVNTIDMYQGDENKYLIVSLVRSNSAGKIGFLQELNRRCVAQSRAKCGMYFIGNKETLSTKMFPWGSLIENMDKKGCVGETLPIQCKKHKDKSRYDVKDSSELKKLIENPAIICKYQCGEYFDCKEHRCKRPCIPEHPNKHNTCQEMVEFIFPVCKHEGKKRCYESMIIQKCKRIVPFVFKCCNHPAKKPCFEPETKQKCKEKCSKMMVCNLHPCTQKCYPDHEHIKCQEEVTFKFPNCGHSGKKMCFEDIVSKQCKAQVPHTFRNCGHEKKLECHLLRSYLHSNDVALRCEKQVSFKFQKCSHNAEKLCYQKESEITCTTKIEYIFPNCKHPSPKKKKCSEPITWHCKKAVYVKGPCNHDIQKECSQSSSSVNCEKPCNKKRNCSHPCTNKCGEDCNKGDCKLCRVEHEKKLETSRKEATQRIKRLEECIKNKPTEIFNHEELSQHGSTGAAFMEVYDKVTKFIVPMHNWYPTITKIEKVTNLALEKKYEEVRLTLSGDHESKKFHGTDDNGVEGITRNGFRIGKPGMYGAGIYFATDSSKSSQKIYTKGSNKLLLCKVLLGKAKKVDKADPSITLHSLRKEGFDSVFAPRDTKNKGGVMNDEFVVFDPRQAIVEYIIHYNEGLPRINFNNAPTQVFSKVKMVPNRVVNLQDPRENIYRLAEGHFYRMTGSLRGASISTTNKITSITVAINPKLQDLFNKKRTEFASQKIPSQEIFAYHGTSTQSVDSILQNNLDMKYAKRQAYGPGNYFSEYPDISLGYGPGLIFCQLLPGKEYKGRELSWSGYHSKVVVPDATSGTSQMVIIQNSDQILPLCVIHFN